MNSISLHPLTFDEVVTDILKTKPEPKQKKAQALQSKKPVRKSHRKQK